jgi:hypothetical protein
MSLSFLTKEKSRRLSRRVVSLSLSTALAVNSLLAGVPIFNTADAATLDPFPSTNTLNESSGQPYVELASSSATEVELRLINPKNKSYWFEVRKDNEVSPYTSKHGPCRVGAEPLSTSCTGRYLAADDYSYPSVMVAAGSTVVKSYSINSNVAVRSTFGPERKWDFDWTTFSIAYGVCKYDFQAQKMWEVTWGHSFENRNGLAPVFTPSSHGGLTTINGSPTSWNDYHLYVTDKGAALNAPYQNTYGFADGTVRTVDVSWSDVNGCQIPNISWRVLPRITKLDAYYVTAKYKGIGLDIAVDDLTDATSVTVATKRENGPDVVKTSKPTGGVLAALNTGSEAKTTAPIVIQQGTYDEAGSSSWNQPVGAVWNSTTIPTQITVTIARELGASLVKTISINDVGTSLAILADVMPADTTAPKMLGYQLSDYYIGLRDTSPTITGELTDSESNITAVKYAIWPLDNAGKRLTAVRGWTDLSAVDGAYDETSEETNSLLNGLINFPQGRYELGIRGYDSEGNRGSGGDLIFYVDNTLPDFSASLSSTLFNSTATEPILSGSITDSISPIDKIHYAIWERNSNGTKGAVVRNWTNLPAADGTYDEMTEELNTTLNLTALTEGEYILGVRGLDAAQNRVSGGDIVFRVDNTLPEVSGVALNSQLVLNDDIRSENCVTPSKFHIVNGKIDLGAVIKDAASGVTNATYKIRKVSEGGCTQTAIYQSNTAKMVNDGGNDWVTLQSSAIDTAADTNLVDGNYTIQMTVKDAAGNQTTKYIDIAVDNTAPVADITSHENGGVVSGTVNLVGEVVDAHPMNTYLQITGPNGYVISSQYRDGRTSHEHSWDTAPLVDGLYTIRFEVKDQAGNKAAPGVSVDKITLEVKNTPVVTGDYFVAEEGQLNVGFFIQGFTDANKVTVTLFDIEDNVLALNYGDSAVMMSLLNSNPVDGISSPFYIPNGGTTDGYWVFGNPEWLELNKPAYAIVTVESTKYGVISSDKINFLSPGERGYSYEQLIASLPTPTPLITPTPTPTPTPTTTPESGRALGLQTAADNTAKNLDKGNNPGRGNTQVNELLTLAAQEDSGLESQSSVADVADKKTEKGKVKGESTSNDEFKVVGAANDEGCSAILGVCWYWYIPVVVLAAGAMNYAVRRRATAPVSRMRR